MGATVAALPIRSLGRVALVALLVLTAVGLWNGLQPIPALAATLSRPSQYAVPGSPPNLPWPAVGSAAVGVSGLGLVGASSEVAPAPAASIAKVMTALVLLGDKPVAPGETGPVLTLTSQDVDTYVADKAQGQSVVPVVAGERLTEFEALEALLIPSGNNIAETLARWDAGSVDAFVARMNQRAAQLHLTKTSFADPAGVSTQTVSTPANLVTLGMAAMQQRAFAQIVNLQQATLPIAGIVYNVNSALGSSGIIGIKTGSGLNSGANFLFAAAATIDGQQVVLYGCVMGLPTLDEAFKEARALVSALESAVRVRKVVARGDAVGGYNTPWGASSNLVAADDVTLVEWPGTIVRERLDAPRLVVERPIPRATAEGKLHIVLGDQQLDVPLFTASSLDPPGVLWRWFRINMS